MGLRHYGHARYRRHRELSSHRLLPYARAHHTRCGYRGSDPAIRQYIREDGTPSFFSDVFEAWWWCLQTLTSEGYGVPWAPVSPTGKIIAIFAALFGTIILALPIAVVGVTFDDEWVKQAKINKFAVSATQPHSNAPQQPLPFAHTLSSPSPPQAESCVYEYNQITRNGTRAVPDLYKNNGNASLLMRIIFCLCPNAKEHNTRLAKRTDEKQQHHYRNRRSSSSPSTPMPGSMPEKMEEITAVEEGEDGAGTQQTAAPSQRRLWRSPRPYHHAGRSSRRARINSTRRITYRPICIH